jgi:hypothetical protein
MFDLTARRLVWLPVTFKGMQSVGDALAEPVDHTIELQVDLVDLDEFGRLFVSPLDDEGNPRPDAVPPATPDRVKEWNEINDVYRAKAIVTDWRKVKSNGSTLPFSTDALEKLMKVPNFNTALFMNAYPTAYAGMKDTRLGNSEGSPVNGPGSDDGQQ